VGKRKEERREMVVGAKPPQILARASFHLVWSANIFQMLSQKAAFDGRTTTSCVAQTVRG